MADKSEIEWTDATWNPIRGCRRVSAGCQNCYAEKVAARFAGVDKRGRDQPYKGLVTRNGRWNGSIMFLPEKLVVPLQWQKARMIFVNSMSDLFFEGLEFEKIAAIFAIMGAASRHTFQVLTKRPKRALQFFEWLEKQANASKNETLSERRMEVCFHHLQQLAPEAWLKANRIAATFAWPLSNVWLGVSVENQATADERIPLLLRCPAAVRWISGEPLLDEVNLSPWLGQIGELGAWTGFGDRLDWVVVGGESGPGSRPMHPDWARAIRDQCQAAGVAFHFKQWGAWRESSPGSGVPVKMGKKAAGRVLDGRTWDEVPTAQPP